MIIDFILLLIYSLLPGFAKIFNTQELFLLNLPIILILIFKNKNKLYLKKTDLLFLFFFIYIILNTIFIFFSPFTNRTGLYMGIFMYLIPFVGFFYSRLLEFDIFCKIIIRIILVHCFIGILMYPAFGFGKLFENIFQKLHDGVFYGRMSSVSGSLGLGNLLLVGFIISYHLYNESRFLLILITFCLLLTLQRSAWLGVLFTIILSTILNYKNIGIKKVFNSFLLLCLLLISINNLGENSDYDFLFSRFSEFGQSAASERSEMWIGGINNFFIFPYGAGIGQVGQISARYAFNPNLYSVPDGDFIRIISETGIVGLFFYFFIFLLIIFSLFFLKSNKSKNVIIISIMIGYVIQMIGSNITEFYFTNFLYWIFIGYFFQMFKFELNKKTK